MTKQAVYPPIVDTGDTRDNNNINNCESMLSTTNGPHNSKADNIITPTKSTNETNETNETKRRKKTKKKRKISSTKKGRFMKPESRLMFSFFKKKDKNKDRNDENSSPKKGRETNSKEVRDFRKEVVKNQNEMLTKFEKKSVTKALKTLPRRDLESHVDLPPISQSIQEMERCKHCHKPLKVCDEVVYGEYCIARVFDFCKKHFYVSTDDITKKYRSAYTSSSRFINYKQTGKLDTCDERIPPVCMLEKSYIEAIQIKGMRDAFNGWNNKMN